MKFILCTEIDHDLNYFTFLLVASDCLLICSYLWCVPFSCVHRFGLGLCSVPRTCLFMQSMVAMARALTFGGTSPLLLLLQTWLDYTWSFSVPREAEIHLNGYHEERC